MSAETERPLIDVARARVHEWHSDLCDGDPMFAAGYVAGYEAGRLDAIFDTRDTDGLLRERIAQLEAQLAARPVTGVVVDSADVRAMRDTLTMKQWKLSDDDLREALTAALRTATTVPLASAEVALHETATRGTTPMRTPLYRGISEPAQRGEASDAD